MSVWNREEAIRELVKAGPSAMACGRPQTMGRDDTVGSWLREDFSGKTRLLSGVAEGFDEAGKLEDLDVGGAGGPIMVPADDYVAAG
jgi:hypothetical protein